MFDSYTDDQASDLEPCWSCGKVNCDCDEQYEQVRDEEMRNEDEL